ncbi:MAG: hypothetical protein AMXMBFR80_07660 [Dehalococcoidia bacterium]
METGARPLGAGGFGKAPRHPDAREPATIDIDDVLGTGVHDDMCFVANLREAFDRQVEQDGHRRKQPDGAGCRAGRNFQVHAKGTRRHREAPSLGAPGSLPPPRPIMFVPS